MKRPGHVTADGLLRQALPGWLPFRHVSHQTDMRRSCVLVLCLVLFFGGVPQLVGADSSPTKTIDSGRSVLTVRVFKAGLFSAFGHNHVIKAPVAEGTVNEQTPRVELQVRADQLRVMDEDVSDKDRGEIQTTMLGPKVLDSQRFPEIRFRSTKLEEASPGHWKVQGELTLHGQTRPVTVLAERREGRYFGSASLKQRDFGIIPVTVAGGTVKVRDEVRIEFEIVVQD
jgi:polyisoprenoid-binding protein YceI